MLGVWDHGGMMLGTVDRQGSLLGVDSLLSKLFEGDDSSFYARMAANGDDLVSDEDFADCYSAGMGRPSIPPSLLMKTVLLQVREDLSDREAARRAAKDLDWKRALGLEADEVAFHHTSLSVFRSRLLVNDADERVLRVTLERAVEAGLFPRRVLAIVDSTGVMGAAAVADTYTLLRQAIAKLGQAAGDRLAKRMRRTINRLCVNKARIDWADASARRRHLGELVELAKELLTATAGDEDLTEGRDLLVRIVDQDIDDDPDSGGPAIRRGVATDRVVSVVDPDMRHGRKSASRRVDGYKSHLITDHDSELILGVAVTAANHPDGPEAAGLVAQAKDAGVPVTEVLGDTAYGDGDTRVAVEETGAKVTAKTQPPAATGRFTKTDFIVDPETPSATCPAGQIATHTTRTHDHKGRQVSVLWFGAEVCGACPLRKRCTTNADGRSITLNFHEARLQAARAEQARPSTRNKLRRRALVERKLAETKRHGAGQARYRGARKVLLQQRFTAAMVNLKRLFTIDPNFGGASA